MTDVFFLLSFDGIDSTQRVLIQSQVEKKAEKWWHQQANVWIVRGGSANEWMDWLSMFVPKLPANYFVFMLPAVGQRKWAARGKAEVWKWIVETYSTSSGTGPTKQPAATAK